MTSSWLASFVLIVVMLGLGGLVTAGIWVALLLLSRWDTYLDERGSSRSESPGPRAARS
jgi:hypothetical protein